MITFHYNGKQYNPERWATCPNCNRFNALLFDRECNQPSDDYVLKCRDCGAEVVVLTTEEKSLWTLPVADGHALKALGYSDKDVDEMMPRDEQTTQPCSSMFIHGVDCGCDDSVRDDIDLTIKQPLEPKW